MEKSVKMRESILRRVNNKPDASKQSKLRLFKVPDSNIKKNVVKNDDHHDSGSFILDSAHHFQMETKEDTNRMFTK